MKIVIQCAGSKDPKAGYFRTTEGNPIKFVAHPQFAPSDGAYTLARPDDLVPPDGKIWRDLVTEYNESPAGNPFGLFPAYRLYLNRAYGALVDRFGEKSVYVLSAGWGLIRANFLTPQYDITFSANAEPFKRRRQRDLYADFCHLTNDGVEQVLFFGGKGYLPLFCRLTAASSADRVVFFNSQTSPNAPGCRVVRYEATRTTNWHYDCVNEFVAGNLAPP